MIRILKQLVAHFLPARWGFARCWAGGHWELVDFDRLWSPFTGRIWLRFERCSTIDLGRRSEALIRCEDHGPTAQVKVMETSHANSQASCARNQEAVLTDQAWAKIRWWDSQPQEGKAGSPN